MLNATRSVLVSAPRESVRLFLRDLSNLATYEQKVDKVQASYPGPDAGFYEASGRWAGIPWSGAFTVRFTKDGGFRSEMVRGPLKRVTGGFALRAVTGGTVVTHDEQYLLPWALRPLTPLLKRWLDRSIDLELREVKEGAERLSRRLQLREIETSLQ